MVDDGGRWYEGKEVLVTGGLGFLGSNLALALHGLGARLTLFDALLPLYGGNPFNIEGLGGAADVVQADIRDFAALERAVEGKDVVFNIAAQTSHVDSMTDPWLDVDMNCRGQINLLEAVRRRAPAARVVYAGSRAQYGRPASVPVREDTPGRPTDVYSANKAAGEAYHFVYASAFDLWVTSLRINNAYGPRHQMKHGKYGILNWFVRLALDGRTIRIFGDGAQMRDYHYVDDVTEAFLLAGRCPEARGETFVLGGPEPVSFARLVQQVVEKAGSGSCEHVPWPEDRKAIEVGDFRADFSKARDVLGWEPAVGLAEGLERTVRFYREHRDRYWTAEED